MIRRYITLIYWSAILSGLFAFPTAITAQEQTMTREERIKALERLKMEDARWETVTVMQTGKEVPLEIEKLELPPLSVFFRCCNRKCHSKTSTIASGTTKK